MWTLALCSAIAILSFYYGRRSKAPFDPKWVKLNLSKNYFIGLNYLLNEQNDKALQLLIQSLTVDSDTIETHLALGSLFRRRGELSRAIRIHQNIIARPNLNTTEKNQALLALAYDYLAAGMLDRAEHSFWQVSEDKLYRIEALYKLIDIYQRERRWLQAIEVAQQLIALGENTITHCLSHFYCERAALALKQQQSAKAILELQQAKKYQKNLARIYLLMGDAYQQQNEIKQALAAYQQVQQVDADYLSEAIPKILKLYQQLNEPQALIVYLQTTYAKQPRVSIGIALAECLKAEQGLTAAIAFLKKEVMRQPSLKNLLQWIIYEQQAISDTVLKEPWQILQQLAENLIQHKPIYRCQHCGFAGRLLFWQCPGCKKWTSIKPILGVEGDG